jgi:hypothetical protein
MRDRNRQRLVVLNQRDPKPEQNLQGTAITFLEPVSLRLQGHGMAGRGPPCQIVRFSKVGFWEEVGIQFGGKGELAAPQS